MRLASAAMVTADFDSKAIFDFSVVNGKIYAIYERLPEHGATYAAYSYAIPVADRTPGEWATLQVRLDQGGTRVTWKVNGRTVLSTDRIGTRAFDRTYMILDHGGTEERLKLKQLTCGFGLFTVLDAAAGPRARAWYGWTRRRTSTTRPGSDPRRPRPSWTRRAGPRAGSGARAQRSRSARRRYAGRAEPGRPGEPVREGPLGGR
ncbi:DUF6081 family protein [Streptomyces thermocarboxydus]